MRSILEEQKLDAAASFCFEGTHQAMEPFGNGHINDTFRVSCRTAEQETKRYILQRMNKEIFQKPVELMENIEGVTSYLRKIIAANEIGRAHV